MYEVSLYVGLCYVIAVAVSQFSASYMQVQTSPNPRPQFSCMTLQVNEIKVSGYHFIVT